jgi:hypothetical protein
MKRQVVGRRDQLPFLNVTDGRTRMVGTMIGTTTSTIDLPTPTAIFTDIAAGRFAGFLLRLAGVGCGRRLGQKRVE